MAQPGTAELNAFHNGRVVQVREVILNLRVPHRRWFCESGVLLASSTNRPLDSSTVDFLPLALFHPHEPSYTRVGVSVKIQNRDTPDRARMWLFALDFV